MSNWDWAFWAAGGVVAMAGLLLCGWALLRDRSRGRRRCPRCWYDMAGVPGLTCPECGKQARSEKGLGRTKPRWRWAMLGLVLITLGGGAAVVPAVRSGGWVNYPPVWSLQMVMRFFDKEAKVEYDQRWSQSVGRAAWLSQRAMARARPTTPSTTQWQRLLAARRCTVLLRAALRTPADASGDPGAWGGTQLPSDRLLDGPTGDAMYALGSTGDESRLALPVLLRILQSDDVELRHAAAQAIVSLKSGGYSAGALARMVRRSPSGLLREEAANVLRDLGEKAGAAGPALRLAIESDGLPAVRAAAAHALATVAPGSESTLASLERAIADQDAVVRCAVVNALSLLAMRERNDRVAATDAGASVQRAPAGTSIEPRVVEALNGVLADPDREVRSTAVRAYAGCDDALPILRWRWDVEADEEVRLAIAESISQRWPGPWFAGELAEIIEHSTDDGSLWAMGLVARFGAAAEPAVPALASAARTRPRWISLRMIDTLAGLGPISVPSIVGLLADGPLHARREVATKLGNGYWEVPAQCDGLVAALGDSDAIVRLWVVRALGRACGDEVGACRRVCELLTTDDDPMVRRECAQYLGWEGRRCEGAGTALASAMDDANVLVRHAAATSLAALRDAGRVEESRAGLERALHDKDDAVRKIAEKSLRAEK